MKKFTFYFKIWATGGYVAELSHNIAAKSLDDAKEVLFVIYCQFARLEITKTIIHN